MIPEDDLGYDEEYEYDEERRSPVLWILVAALVLVLVGAGWWFLVRDDGTRRDRGRTAAPASRPRAPRPRPRRASTSPAGPRPRPPAPRRPNEDVNGDQVSYDASNMLDGVPETAWRTPGDATGMSLTFTLREPTELHRIGLINGYAKTSTDAQNRTFDWYLGNRRVNAVVWQFDDGSKVRQQLSETRELQMIDVDDVITGTVVLKLVRGLAAGRGHRLAELHRDQRGLAGRRADRPDGVRPARPRTAAARSASARETSRWVTIRTAVGPTVATRTPCSAAAATNAAASLRSTTTMLVSTVAGSSPQASASSRACAWSSASRSTWWSRACSPAAARTPTWRMPPPIRLRRTRASSTASREPTISEPTGAPSPLDRQTARTEAIGAVLRERDAGGDVRVPDPGTVEVDAGADPGGPLPQLLELGEREHGAAGEVVGVLDRDRRGADEERAHVRREQRPDRRPGSARPRGCVHVRIVIPPMAPCAPSSARAMCAEDSQSTSWPGATSEPTASTFAIDPVGVNSAASCPNSPATRSSRARTVGSSPYTSSPTSARAIAARIASVGRVRVSERRSIEPVVTKW